MLHQDPKGARHVKTYEAALAAKVGASQRVVMVWWWLGAVAVLPLGGVLVKAERAWGWFRMRGVARMVRKAVQDALGWALVKSQMAVQYSGMCRQCDQGAELGANM